MLSDDPVIIQNEVLPGKDSASEELALIHLSNEALADLFVGQLRRLRLANVRLTDALRHDRELRAVLSEFRSRMYDLAAADAEAGATLRLAPHSVPPAAPPRAVKASRYAT